YGGTVEKFIGDAVMAVWGTPIATEDDAERAVRAALDLVAAVPELEGSLEARAAVFTGEAAVTLGADGEGMVAGDLVNTASRAQAIAPPGAVYVGDATRRVTEQTVAYEDAGSHELKGKVGLVPLWRALRIVAGERPDREATADRRGRGRRVGRAEAPARRRGARRRPRGARLPRAAPSPSARARGRLPLRARGPVRGLAALLRASRRAQPGHPR